MHSADFPCPDTLDDDSRKHKKRAGHPDLLWFPTMLTEKSGQCFDTLGLVVQFWNDEAFGQHGVAGLLASDHGGRVKGR